MRLDSLIGSLSTQARIMALLLFVIVPFSALLVYAEVSRYRLLEEHAEEQTLHMAQMVAANQSGVITRTRQLLEALVNDLDIQHRDWAQCSKTLPEFFEHFKDSYSVFNVADITGKIVCSAKDLPTAVNIADRNDFKDAVSSRRFIVGDINRSRSTGLMSIMMRYPVVDDNHNVLAVVTAQVSAAQFDKASSQVELPNGGELIMTDRNHKIVLRKPDEGAWIGKPLPAGLLRALHARDGGMIETEGTDGVTRIYGFSRVGNAEESDMHVLVGYSHSMIEGAVKRDLYQNIAILLALVLFMVAGGWFAVNALVLKKVKILVDALDNIRGRETSARTASTPDDGGTSQARAIDETAGEIERMLNLLREETIRDPLTSLYNRRYLAEVLKRELMLAHKKGGTLGVISADIDHFKQINDRFGHEVGDKVLVSIASILMQNIRGSDVVCRVGGEEFTIVMPGASLGVARARAEGFRQAVAQSDIVHNGKGIGHITISLGVSVFPDDGKDAESLLRSADQALYQAKNTGRNRVVTLPELPEGATLE